MRMASTSGLRSRLRSDRVAYLRPRGSFLPWALPLAGFRARLPCITTGLDPDRIISLRGPTRPRFSARGRASPIRSWVFGVLPDSDVATRGLLGKSHPCLRRMLAARFAVPSAY